VRRYETVEAEVKRLNSLVAEIAVVEAEGGLCACIAPDLEEAARQGIVNLTAEIRWYAVELYNMDAPEGMKIRSFHVAPSPLPKSAEGGIDTAGLAEWVEQASRPHPAEPDIDDPLYRELKAYIGRMTEQPVYPSSHFEFDLGLDSLDHVELFAFVEESFGVTIHDRSFAAMMTPKALWRYVRAHRKRMEPRPVAWSKLLRKRQGTTLHTSPWALRLFKWLALPLFKLYFRLEISGTEKIPEAPCIIAPSHQSMLDGFIITASLPTEVLEQTFTLAFDLVFGRGLMTPVARYGQLVLIDVNNDLKASVESSGVPLMAGKNLIVFPEGARSRDRQLLEFRPLFAMLAKEFDVPIVPVVLDGTFEALRAGMLFPRPARVVVTYLDPVRPEEGESVELLSMRVKKRIREEMEAHPLV
jgi:long-chain acyl-CoA synthetase